MSDKIERRLAAIVAMDIVGYSRLMGVDEAGTLNALRSRRANIIDPSIAEFGGRIVKTTGDGLLVELPSVVAAVKCAVQVQAAMRKADADIPAEKRLVLRIGINLGDIIIEDEDIFGDGVNIAARLEQIATPGGVCISQAAFEQVRDKIDYRFVDIGEQSLKNITRPVRAYSFVEDSQVNGAWRGRVWSGSKKRVALTAALTLALGIAGFASFFAYEHIVNANSDVPPSLDKASLSIAVLPFANLSEDENQDYFADALTEDLTDDLSRISGSFVISRSTAAIYTGKDIDTRQIAAELRVSYLLEGTIRKDDDSVRVSVRLTDGATGGQVWSERYNKTADDMYTFQNEVTGRIARSLNLELKEAMSRQAERGKVGSIDANDFALRAWAELWTKPQRPETNRTALELTERALQLDPNNADALAVATYAYARAATYGWDMSRDEAIRLGIAAGERAVSLDHRNADAVYALGFIYYRAEDMQKSLEMMRQAISLNRNHAPSYFFSGVIYIRLGKPREAIEWVERAFALSPHDPLRSVWYGIIGRAQVLIGEDTHAIETAQKGIAANPKHSHNFAVLASAHAHLGQMKEASDALEMLMQLLPDVSLSRYQITVAGDDPLANATYRRLTDGLAKAGLAE